MTTIEIELSDGDLGVLWRGGGAGLAYALRLIGNVVGQLSKAARVSLFSHSGAIDLLAADADSVRPLLDSNYKKFHLLLDGQSSPLVVKVEGAHDGSAVFHTITSREEFWHAVDEAIREMRRSHDLEIVCPWERGPDATPAGTGV